MRWDWLYEWCDEGQESRRRHMHVYFSYRHFNRLTVLWPVGYLVRAWILLNDKFAEHRSKPSLIDKEIRAAIRPERIR